MINLSLIRQISTLVRGPRLVGAQVIASSHNCQIFSSKNESNNLMQQSMKANLSTKKILTIPSFEGITIPEDRQKLKFLEKVPQIATGVKMPKMTKRLDLIRGEEEIHTDFIHQQYGIVAQRGGFLRFGHIEMIRMGIFRKINTKKAFAIWRIEAPWKPMFKKGIGKRMGGGKGNISYYATPIKAKRVIIEVAGKCTFEEVHPMLKIIAHKLPFPATVMTQDMINEERETEARLEKENLNDYTFKYILQNNMLGSHSWAKKYIDFKYFGKYE